MIRPRQRNSPVQELEGAGIPVVQNIENHATLRAMPRERRRHKHIHKPVHRGRTHRMVQSRRSFEGDPPRRRLTQEIGQRLR
jgi:hypothetical protein